MVAIRHKFELLCPLKQDSKNLVLPAQSLLASADEVIE